MLQQEFHHVHMTIIAKSRGVLHGNMQGYAAQLVCPRHIRSMCKKQGRHRSITSLGCVVEGPLRMTLHISGAAIWPSTTLEQSLRHQVAYVAAPHRRLDRKMQRPLAPARLVDLGRAALEQEIKSDKMPSFHGLMHAVF